MSTHLLHCKREPGTCQVVTGLLCCRPCHRRSHPAHGCGAAQSGRPAGRHQLRKQHPGGQQQREGPARQGPRQQPHAGQQQGKQLWQWDDYKAGCTGAVPHLEGCCAAVRSSRAAGAQHSSIATQGAKSAWQQRRLWRSSPAPGQPLVSCRPPGRHRRRRAGPATGRPPPPLGSSPASGPASRSSSPRAPSRQVAADAPMLVCQQCDPSCMGAHHQQAGPSGPAAQKGRGLQQAAVESSQQGLCLPCRR